MVGFDEIKLRDLVAQARPHTDHMRGSWVGDKPAAKVSAKQNSATAAAAVNSVSVRFIFKNMAAVSFTNQIGLRYNETSRASGRADLPPGSLRPGR